MTALQRLAGEFPGLGIVPVYHVRKMDAEDPLDAVSGTLGLAAGADAALVLKRTGNGTTLYGRGRDIEEYERAVEFNKQTCKWRILGDAAEVHRSDTRKKILTALAEADGAMTPSAIAIASNLSAEVVTQRLYQMLQDGEVAKHKRGEYQLSTPAVRSVSS